MNHFTPTYLFCPHLINYDPNLFLQIDFYYLTENSSMERKTHKSSLLHSLERLGKGEQGYINNKKRSHTQLDSRKQVIAFLKL